MASLKKELDEYLSAKDKSSVEINIPFKLNALPLERWYKSKGSGTTTNGLDSAVQSSWFPAMILVLIWFLSRNLPGGQAGMRFLSQLCCWASSNSASLLSSMSGSSTSLVSSSVSSAANAVSKTLPV
ncbi:uncharacterized protein LOC124170936 isoform X3 [Ischnura elegans]|uniref:uncharacterized protein LOC124170936 isoform X3 n=1 Tax=Ischnura elegans TaxID=197161 RepID=UPI001ED87B3A|nr:uncharacterized protein LOC124170936 isoform X3 [Ischnura elegans]